jgi:hypothetical protein
MGGEGYAQRASCTVLVCSDPSKVESEALGGIQGGPALAKERDRKF